MTDEQTHGANLAAASPADRATVFAAGNRSDFAAYDSVLARLFDLGIRGKQLFEPTWATKRTELDSFSLLHVNDDDRAALAAVLDPSAQQARGAWYLPDQDRPIVGIAEFAHWAGVQPRFSVLAADSQRLAVRVNTPDTMVHWGALAPVMDQLYLPIKLRSGYWLGDRKPELMAKDWAIVDKAYATLGIDQQPLELFRDGRRWATLRLEGVIEARSALLDAWRAAPNDVGERAICLLISSLVERYYVKAKGGVAQRTKVMNKGLERALTGAFGGDWIALVRYLGESLHPAEQIATAVEPTSVVFADDKRSVDAAAATGVSVDEIRKIMGVYWGSDSSPVAKRVDVMRRWWEAFDEIHARQKKGRPSLWGLIGDRLEDMHGQQFDDGRLTPQGYRMLPAPLVSDIEDLWRTAVLPRYPTALVTEPFPHGAFADAIGPAAHLWHEIALTCWFICEGPYSRTDIAGMQTHYDRRIKELDDLGTPIDSELFSELREAEKRLRDRPPSEEDVTHYDAGEGLSISLTVSYGPGQKDGFEHLNDCVTRWRRQWMKQHFDDYLEAVWERPVRAVGDEYHRFTADKSKPPTAKQFAKFAAPAANAWFGGDLGGLCSALGLPAPDPQGYRRLLPGDRAAFVAEVREKLGGERWADSDNNEDRDERTRKLRLAEIAGYAPDMAQLWEATGQPPTLRGSSWARYRLETAYGTDLEAGWEHVVAAVRSCLSDDQLGTSLPSAVATAPARPDTSAEMPRVTHESSSVPASPIATDAPARGVGGFLRRLRGE